MSVVTYFRLSMTSARGILGDVEPAVSRWRSRGRALGMSAEELAAVAGAFEHAERRAARAAAKG
jgi:hypothetical protein